MTLVKKTLLLLGAILSLCAMPTAGGAALLNIDYIIYQSAAGTTVNDDLLSGTLDLTVSGNTLTILMRNTSPDNAFVGGGAPATMLLTGFGLQLGTGIDVVSGTVTINTGSTAVNFTGSDISSQWGYGNSNYDGYSQSGVPLVTDVVSSVNNGQQDFKFSGSASIGGPDYGAVSASETEFGNSQAGVNDTIKFVLILNTTAPSFETINAGNVVLAFGSPTLVHGPPGPDEGLLPVPEPASMAVWGGLSLLGLALTRRRNQWEG